MSDEKKKKLKIILITVAICLALLIALVISVISSGVKYNDDSAVGNTPGNLYNGGMVCEYDGYVYIADPTRENALFKMKPDGSDAKLISSDNVSYINVYDKYIFYKRHNYKSNVEELFKGNLYGIYRMKKNGNDVEEIHRGIVGSITLSGNYLYYQRYENDMFNLAKVKIDGTEDEVLVELTSVVPACIYDKKLYYAELNGNHNLMVLDTKDDVIKTYMEGNVYMPDIYDGYIYYIDAGNERALTKKNIATGETTVISGSDRVISYNMCGDKNVIFYQAENGVNHMLKKTDLNGEYTQVVVEGDCNSISITSKYTYFVKIFGEDDKTLYRTPTEGVADPEIFVIKEK